MTKQKTKAQLSMDLEAAQKRIAELEQSTQATVGDSSRYTEQDRREDEAFYRTLIEQTNDGIVILDEQGDVIVWNSALENIMDISRAEAVGRKYWEIQYQISTPETRARLSFEYIRDAFQSTFKTGEHPGLGKIREVEIQLKDGSRKFIQISPFAIKTEKGYRAGSITRDVTEQRRAADISRENEERFMHVFHASPSQMAITDGSTGKYIDVNSSFLQSLGFTREEVIGKTATELNLFFDPSQRASLLGKMKEQGYLRGEDVLVQTKTGQLRHGFFSAEYLQVQNRQFLLTVMNDVTERKQMEEMLFKNQQALLEVQNIAKIQSWTADFQTRFINLGPGYDHIFEWPEGRYELDAIKDLIHPQDREYVTKAWAQAEQHHLLDIEYRVLTNKGLKWIHTKTIRNEGGMQGLIPGFTQDVTERRQAEELTHAQRNLARITSTTTSLEDALPHCLDVALEVSGMDSGGIYLFNSNGQSFDLVHHQGLGKEFIQAVSHYEVDAPNVQMVLAGMMFYFGEADMQSKKLYQDEGLCSLASIPIIDHGHTLGCINIASHALKQVPEITRQAIETIIAEIGAVIAHLQTESLLRESEEKYRLLAENISDVIWIMDLETSRFSYLSPSVLQLRGYSVDEVLAQDVSASLTPASAEYLTRVISERLVDFEQGIIKVYIDEVEQPCKDGTTIWTESTTRFVKDPETGKLEVYGVSRNITERKKAETDIRLIEKRNTALIEHAPDGIALLDCNGVFMFASPSTYRMFGYGPEEIIGISSREKVHPQDVHLLADLREKLQTTPEESQTLAYRFQHKDGSYRWLESTYTNMFGEPSVDGVVINFRDITDRKLTEEITHQQSEQLRLLYEASQQLNRTLDVKEIYQTICDFMAIIAPSDTLFISAFDPNTQLITCRAYWMQNNWLDVSPFPAIPLEEEGKGTQSRVIRSGESMLLNDYQSFLKTAQHIYYVEDATNEITEEGPEEEDEDVTRSAMIVPLKSGGSVKGIIQVASYHLNAYTEDQLKLLEALSLHIASAEQNALLYSQLLVELNERKQVEEALLKSESLLIEAQRIGRIGHMEWNGRDKELICSKELYDILGLPHDAPLTKEAIGHMMFTEDTAALQQQDETSFKTHKDLNYQYRIHLADGRERWLHQIGKITYNEDGAPIRMMAIIQDITERKQTEDALRDSEARARAMLQAIPDLMFRMDRQGVFMDYKADISQLAVQESDLPLIGKRNRDVSSAEFADLIESEIEKTLETSTLQAFEYKLEIPKVGLRDYEARMTPSGKDEVLAVVRDITEQNKAKSALRASEEKYRGLIESLDNVVVSMDAQGKVLFINDIAAEQLGSIAEELIGKSMYDLFPEPIALTQMNQIQQVISEDKGHVFESISMIRGEPRWYRTSMQPIHDEGGYVSQVLINSTDIHDLKTTQQKLQELNRTLEERVQQRTAEVQDLYENSPAGYHSLDATGNIILINQTELKWLGYSREELIGKSIFNLLTPASIATFKINFPEFKQSGRLKDLDLEFIRKDGTILPVLLNATAVYDEQKNYILSRTTVMDNTEHKAADEALRNANLELARAMRMKDEFLASMSHELRTPLNGILGLSEALQLDVYGPLNEKQKSTLGHVEDSGRHLLELINDILDVSKIEAGKFELEMLPCSLGDICQSSIHLTKGMAGKKHQNVNFTMNPASININADARRLKQVLVNLLSNAVKFTPENGSLGLEVTKNEMDHIVYISVWDNGIGISSEDIKKLFQPFVQLDSSLSRQQTGTGLGLTLVQRLVEMHGGSIEIQSVPGRSSRFTVAIPCLPENSTAETFDNTLQSKFHYALIVEDETMDAGHLARYCKALGINPILHSTGEGALERAIATRPNVVFLDLNLPDISGWEVLTRLKSNPETQHIPVVITSVDDEKQRATQLNVDGYLVKFFAVSDLRTVLENIQKAASTNEAPTHTVNQPASTVMIVDDNEINIETVVDYLSAKNFNVVSSYSGVDFLTRVPHIRPDIILMDIQMPEMDGLETTRRLRAMPDQKIASVPVIALTALAMPGDRELCIEAGADEYVTKPFRLKELHELVIQILEDTKRAL